MFRWARLGFACAFLSALSTPVSALDRAALEGNKPPKLLSQIGAFTGPGILNPTEGVVAYDLATPLFSDGAIKTRHVFIPKGLSATYHDRDVFDFPVGTLLFKTFAFPADFRQGEKSVRLIETRLLIRQAQGWQAWPYIWNDDQSDAHLKIAGRRMDVRFTDPSGDNVQLSYAVPNKNQCKTCHSLDGHLTPIGPNARNLNRDIPSAGKHVNQLSRWHSLKMVSGMPELAEIPSVPDYRDATQPLDLRARAWLDVNCAHCHRARGSASNSGLHLTFFESDLVKIGIGKRPVAAGRASGDNRYDIEPGRAENSILWNRVKSVEPGVMMPELGRSLPDQDAIELLRDWINGLEN